MEESSFQSGWGSSLLRGYSRHPANFSPCLYDTLPGVSQLRTPPGRPGGSLASPERWLLMPECALVSDRRLPAGGGGGGDDDDDDDDDDGGDGDGDSDWDGDGDGDGSHWDPLAPVMGCSGGHLGLPGKAWANLGQGHLWQRLKCGAKLRPPPGGEKPTPGPWRWRSRPDETDWAKPTRRRRPWRVSSGGDGRGEADQR
ncbi:unnamed protein product [Prorocentrum cordatum]|uniref:Uncharacterized protein n=1 Tax=Prorocentrum cordatum TaxID=2364126 RepID=A0ABN9PHX7_9DINO|nr:unnamed protein product [Polarella glacialis]